MRPSTVLSVFASLALLVGSPARSVIAQEPGTITGSVISVEDDRPLPRVTVRIEGTSLGTLTGGDGRYTLRRVPPGEHTVVVSWLGYRRRDQRVTVIPGGTHTADFALEAEPIRLSELIVEGASRTPERVVEAPSAISVVDPDYAEDVALTGQAPRALSNVPGVDVVQSGIYDYNINTRGFNSSLNRRMLVLLDGRDVNAATFGFGEWSALTSPVDELGRIEVVRGPGSALYGANAYSGVINMTTPTAREAVGTSFTLGGGELTTARGDLRHAGVGADGRVGYKVNVGFARSESWSESRTSADGGDLSREYAPATDEPIPELTEAIPLFGQTLDPATRAAVGDADAVLNAYGSGRFDYYLDDGSVATVEAGAAYVENTVLITGIGRVQNDRILRPWVRAMWAAPNFNVMGWYAARETLDPLKALASGIDIETKFNTFHGEAQFNESFFDERARIVVGASARSELLDSEGTLFDPANEDRNEYYSGFGQIEFDLTPKLRLVVAARYDDGTLFEGQFSPKGALVFSPGEAHSVRFTVNRAFQTPSQTDFFLRVAAGLPADFAALEAGLRASPLGPALEGVPDGELFTTSSSVPVLALGNNDLVVEKVTSYEVGYKGLIGDRLFVTLDAFYARLSDFVTDLLPGVNPTFAPWTAPDAVPEMFREALEQTVRDQLSAAGQGLAAAGLTRLRDGSSAVVVSYTNAGKVDEYGVEVGLGLAISPELRLDGTYTFFEFDIDPTSTLPGDQLQPNTPRHKGVLSLSYRGLHGFDFRVNGRFMGSYDWAAGVFAGPVPASQTIDLSAGYRINDRFRIHAIATNLLDQERYHIFGGSVIGRRILGGITLSL